ncbi:MULTISPECIES: ScbA/BarX family gamma-butyrolactone biosynthesis protein [Streptomyces]|uniref:ScbA/BarX family gamma-butyrolactone biosynthesis protein n=1 Tax=Streptomyces fuscus TaxID=3048495 RepID=A0ABT7JBU0_9ACTN|nr:MULTISPECIES: ScbA/BarX family gamma-butyrolactone biosynthesis protein [Streptomyces]MCM1977243.1 A-factor biosynthesis protein [Streptomyces sp. G1]MDL2081227.1 ScbA/BarX family gamma-butyrolactone biosynthesis protein [Streptomyces fuscus]SBT90931.1 A-factor biosynthesis hotdog domain-containing protein [Streptomyces sp. DI166]
MPQLPQLADFPTASEALTATVPRELVHRAAVAETLLTGWSRIGTDRFRVTAQWPRAHQLHVSSDRTAYEPLLVTETVRQGGTLIAHTEYDVPLGHRFVLQELRVSTRPEHLRVGSLPAEPEVDISILDIRRRAGKVTAFDVEAAVFLENTQVGSAYFAASWTSDPVYRRLRGGRTPQNVTPLPLPPGLAPEAVGRTVPGDVVLAPGDRRDRWQLRVDTAHPVFFDHPLDHVPGMLLLEAAGQAARVAHGGRRVPMSFHATFDRYAELDLPTWIEVAPGPEGLVQVLGVQGDSAVFACGVGTVAQ